MCSLKSIILAVTTGFCLVSFGGVGASEDDRLREELGDSYKRPLYKGPEGAELKERYSAIIRTDEVLSKQEFDPSRVRPESSLKSAQKNILYTKIEEQFAAGQPFRINDAIVINEGLLELDIVLESESMVEDLEKISFVESVEPYRCSGWCGVENHPNDPNRIVPSEWTKERGLKSLQTKFNKGQLETRVLIFFAYKYDSSVPEIENPNYEIINYFKSYDATGSLIVKGENPSVYETKVNASHLEYLRTHKSVSKIIPVKPLP